MIIGEFGDCRGRSGGAATLHPQSIAGKDNSIQGVENTVQPSGRLGAEGDRYGVPSQRPADHDRLCCPASFASAPTQRPRSSALWSRADRAHSISAESSTS
jgi:hypothetical protein